VAVHRSEVEGMINIPRFEKKQHVRVSGWGFTYGLTLTLILTLACPKRSMLAPGEGCDCVKRQFVLRVTFF